jgi:hypothetical protein
MNEIASKNLKEGMVFKNYKELCFFLNERVKTGGSKIYQFKNWNKYFNFYRKGNKYIITDVYDTPENLTFTEKLESLLLHLMAESEHTNYMIYSPRTVILENLCVINSNYKEFMMKANSMSKHLDIEVNQIYDYLESINSSMKYQFEKVLNSLSNKALILYNITSTVCCLEDGYLIHRTATEQETEYYLKVQRKMLDDLNCDSIKETKQIGVYQEFYTKVNRIIKKEMGFLYFYRSYKIIFNKKNLNIKLETYVKSFLLNKEKYIQYKKDVNKYHLDLISKNANKRRNNSLNSWISRSGIELALMYNTPIKDIAKGLKTSKYSINTWLIRTDGDYLYNIDKLSELLIDINTKPIKAS